MCSSLSMCMMYSKTEKSIRPTIIVSNPRMSESMRSKSCRFVDGGRETRTKLKWFSQFFLSKNSVSLSLVNISWELLTCSGNAHDKDLNSLETSQDILLKVPLISNTLGLILSVGPVLWDLIKL